MCVERKKLTPNLLALKPAEPEGSAGQEPSRGYTQATHVTALPLSRAKISSRTTDQSATGTQCAGREKMGVSSMPTTMCAVLVREHPELNSKIYRH